MIAYRGEYGRVRGPSPFDNTRRVTPSFTPSREVALVYASHPNDIRDAVVEPRIGVYELRVENSLELSTRNGSGQVVDSVATVEHLRSELVGKAGITDYALLSVLQTVEGWRWFNDCANEAEWVTSPLREVANAAYIEPHWLADSSSFVELVSRAGYDGLHYHGHFSSEQLFERPLPEVLAEGGYDHRMSTSEEWRPFFRYQVRQVSVLWLSPRERSGVSRGGAPSPLSVRS